MPANLSDKDFIALTDGELVTLPDQQLAQAYTRAVLLNHRARLEGQRYQRNRDPNLPLPTETEAFKAALEREIAARGKVWKVGLIAGDSWLDDKEPDEPELLTRAQVVAVMRERGLTRVQTAGGIALSVNWDPYGSNGPDWQNNYQPRDNWRGTIDGDEAVDGFETLDGDGVTKRRYRWKFLPED